MASVALCVVAGGAVYERYAFDLFESAAEHFRPADDIELTLIPGAEGWPDGTMLRPHRLLTALPDTDFVFVCDADMRFESLVGPEILPPRGDGIVATLHPGYLGQPAAALPFETRPQSACYVTPAQRQRYFCGGFWGGSRVAVEWFARTVVSRIDHDRARAITPVWHDESALNAALAARGGPELVLDPSYAHPDNDAYYVEHVWRRQLPRRLVALDKPAEHRVGR